MGIYKREREQREQLERSKMTTRLVVSGGVLALLGGILLIDDKKPAQQISQINIAIPVTPAPSVNVGRSWNTDLIWNLSAKERKEWVQKANVVSLQEERFCLLVDSNEKMATVYYRGPQEGRSSCATLHKEGKIEAFFAKDSNKEVWDKRMKMGTQNPGPRMSF